MFGRLFNRFQPTTVEDSVFGTLVNDKRGNWSGRMAFLPIGKEIGITLQLTPENPPTQDHRDFFNELIYKWPSIYQHLKDTLFEDLEDLEDGTTMEQVFDSFVFNELSFIDLTARPRIWEISATTPHDGHTFGIMMGDFDNQGFSMDG